MLIEHLIEPEALVELAKSRRNCKDFEKEFSKPSPRVVSDFPKFKNLRRRTFGAQASDVSEHERMRLEELIRFIGEHSRVKRATEFNGNLTIQENFKLAEGCGFEGFCLLQNKVDGDELESTTIDVAQFEDGIESLEHQATMAKVKEQIAETLGSLLRLSEDITIVEPYFDLRPGMWDSFIELLCSGASYSATGPKALKLLYDADKTRGRKPQDLADKLVSDNPECLEAYREIKFCHFKEKEKQAGAIHNRFIITELAAVSIPHGLEATNESETDDVTLLTTSIYDSRYSQYSLLNGYDLVDEAVVDN
ncbi:hypothetical protein K0504_04535 [Neiella marina]|uniref:Uncharacterized protein n=1 Tax=Neiella holothuriorum TaxID=2870530 RepID=A0ABS7ED73_9GAMM|nr:hypothetical protein [Neiella holothuriorum]MBW8190296.1 hypothetical protein [Neiella holothuriorum]